MSDLKGPTRRRWTPNAVPGDRPAPRPEGRRGSRVAACGSGRRRSGWRRGRPPSPTSTPRKPGVFKRAATATRSTTSSTSPAPGSRSAARSRRGASSRWPTRQDHPGSSPGPPGAWGPGHRHGRAPLRVRRAHAAPPPSANEQSTSSLTQHHKANKLPSCDASPISSSLTSGHCTKHLTWAADARTRALTPSTATDVHHAHPRP